MLLNENNTIPYMRSMNSCLARIVDDGYAEDFKVTEDGLEAVQKKKNYAAKDIQVINFFRFEGESDPDDNAILFVIEATDGTKGTLIDSYGAYSNSDIAQFMQNVNITKKTLKN